MSPALHQDLIRNDQQQEVCKTALKIRSIRVKSQGR